MLIQKGTPFRDAAGNIIGFGGIPKITEYYEKHHSPKSEDSDTGNEDLEKVVNPPAEKKEEKDSDAGNEELTSLGAALEKAEKEKAEKEKKDKDKEK